jgi:hypothetical protein
MMKKMARVKLITKMEINMKVSGKITTSTELEK